MSAAPGAFPVTRHSVVVLLGSSDPETRRRAFETVAATYWKPIYKYIRLRWNIPPGDAEDLTQEFFSQACERGFLERYDQSRARFRTFLRTCIDGTVINAGKAAARLKRGGGQPLLSLDFPGAETELSGLTPAAAFDVDEFFRREFVRSLLELAVRRLEGELAAAGKSVHFDLFRRYDIEVSADPAEVTYGGLAREFGLPETQVTNFLALARRRFRHHVLEALAELTSSREEFSAEARDVLGITVDERPV